MADPRLRAHGVLFKGEGPGKKVTDAGSPVYDAAFWKTWGDGLAEVTTYDLRSPRPGTATSIFVSENFANSLRVKNDPTFATRRTSSR